MDLKVFWLLFDCAFGWRDRGRKRSMRGVRNSEDGLVLWRIAGGEEEGRCKGQLGGLCPVIQQRLE